MGKKEMKQKEDEAKMKLAKEAKDEAGDPAAADDKDTDGEDGKHVDKADDIELIKKMIKDAMGDEAEAMDESEAETYHELAKEAYEAYKEMGYSEEEAQSHAAHALKLAKHMAAKQNEADDKGAVKDGDEKSEEACEEEADDKAKAKKDDEEDAEEADGVESKESAKALVKKLEKKLLETQGALAAMKLAQSKGDVEKYVETKLTDSKRPRAVTKAFREAAGQIVSKKDFDSKWKMFCNGLANSRVAVDYSAMFTEKAITKESGTKSTDKLDFSDCAE